MYQRKVFNRYLTDAEEKKLFRHVWQFRAEEFARRDYYWMQILRHTGMRIGNLARLTVADAYEVLTDPAHRLTLRAEDCKRGQGYVIKFNSYAVEALQQLLKMHPAQQGAGGEPLLKSRKHGALSVRSMQARMRQWVTSAGLGVEATPHWFRHTLAKRILAKTSHQSPLQVVQHALGHSSLNSTAVYTTPDREDIDAAMEQAAR